MKKIDFRLLSLAVLLLAPPINFYLNAILQYGLGMQSISMYVYIIIALFGVYSYRYFRALDKFSAYLFVFLLIGFLFAAMIGGSKLLISSDFNPLESPFLQVFLYCFPLYILTKTCTDYEKALNYLYNFAVFNLLLFFPSYYFSQLYLTAFKIEYMSISYNLLVALCVCIDMSWNKRKLILSLLTIACLMFIVIIGSRGAALSAILYILLLLIVKYRAGEKKGVLGVVLAAVVVIAIFGSRYLSGVNSLIDSGEIYSRNLSKLDDNTLFSHGDRDYIQNVIEAGLDENIFGYGLLGDRIIFQNRHFSSVYSHNILLEMRADFGVLIGPLIFALFLLRLISSFFHFKGYKRDFLVIMIPAGFIKLWFSSSFLISPEFFCLLALVLSQKNKRDRRTTSAVCHDERATAV